jgi:hypothetical protein
MIKNMNDTNKNEKLENISEFEWFLPTSREPELKISIPNDICFNLNQKLYAQMLDKITIGISMDGKTIHIKTMPDIGFCIPKSGTIKDSTLIDSIKKRGIKLPACYLVKKEENNI